jgi:hypothetical protein
VIEKVFPFALVIAGGGNSKKRHKGSLFVEKN